MRASAVLAACLAYLPAARAGALATAAEGQDRDRANPIRKVVTMLQAMQKKVTAEGEKEEALYKKFTCYCTTNGGELTETIAAAEAKVPAVSSEIQEAEAQKAQLQSELKSHQMERDAAKSSAAEGTALREKEAAAYATTKAEYDANLGAIAKAVASLEKGMAGGFLQTSAAQVLRKLAESRDNMLDVDRQAVLSFLSGEQDSAYVPKSGEVTGILKEISDDMAKSLAEATATENDAIQMYRELMSAKTKETAAHTKAIEEKTGRVGDLGVKVQEMKGDLDNTQTGLASDRAFLAELEQGCDTKKAEWEERQKTRGEELVALAEVIKLLNDDDALDIFKRAMPAASFVQRSSSVSGVTSRVLSLLREAPQATGRAPRVGLDLIALALQSKAGGFEKVTKMIDSMVDLLKREQQDDDQKKEYCGAQFDFADDKKKGLESTVSDQELAISSAEEVIAKLAEELKALATGIAELDKSVAQATEQRKEEHEDYNELMALDSQAKDLLGVAKNRLNKFYNPAMYMPPPKKELTQEERIYQSVAGHEAVLVQVSAHSAHGGAPPPPPETFGAYEKKGQETSGVIAMIDLLVKDLDKEMIEAETSEKNAQKDYEAMMADAKAKRASDAKAVADKEGTKAGMETEAVAHKEGKRAAGQELAATAEYIGGLHKECDWLLQYYDVRKEARAGEADSLAQAKAILKGADFSLAQVKESHLRGGAGQIA